MKTILKIQSNFNTDQNLIDNAVIIFASMNKNMQKINKKVATHDIALRYKMKIISNFESNRMMMMMTNSSRNEIWM